MGCFASSPVMMAAYEGDVQKLEQLSAKDPAILNHK
jgi:hypothetical protein